MTPVLPALVLFVAAAGPLDAARGDYQAGSLESARQKLEALLYPLGLEAEADEREGHVLLSATYFALGDAGRAEEEAIKALAVSVEPRPDPVAFPPDFIAFFTPLSTRHAGRIAALHAERKPPPAQPPEPREQERVVVVVPPPPPLPEARTEAERPSRAWSVVPFGVAQFRLGAPQRGVVWLIVHAALVITAGASLFGVLALRGDDGRYAPLDAPTARSLNVLWVASAWLFGAAWAGSTIDGLITSAD